MTKNSTRVYQRNQGDNDCNCRRELDLELAKWMFNAGIRHQFKSLKDDKYGHRSSRTVMNQAIEEYKAKQAEMNE